MDDLTWQQMQAAATSLGLSNVFTLVNGKLMIDVSVLLASNVSSLTATGVVEALFNLREIAAKAQETANSTQQVGSRLAAFPVSTSGTPVNNTVIQAGLIVVRRPLSNTGILGAKN